MDIAAVIAKHNLSVRHIPKQVIGVHEIRHRKDGDEIFMYNGRQMVRRTIVPKHAGMFMVKPVNDTSSTVRWDARTDHLAPTLESSLLSYLTSKE